MSNNRPEPVLIADHGTEEQLGGHAEPVESLSEALISALARMAVKEELAEPPPEETAPPANQVNAPGFAGASMGKPLLLLRDHFYFLARCPVTGDILDAIADDAAGTGSPLIGEWRVACADCKTSHILDLATIRPEQYTPPASPTETLDSGVE